MATRSKRRPASVRGPCDRCGALFYTDKTDCRAPCPNCGHRVGCDD